MKYVHDLPRKVREIPTAWIPMPDGCRLAARILLPEDAESNPVPAILEYIPYRRRDFYALRDTVMHRYYAGHGYAGVRVDLRGAGDSDGILEDEYLSLELDDGVEIIRWLAAQPWCTGKVGMTGISWGGFNSLQIAALRPSPLKAIITACSTDDRYADDVHYMGGALTSAHLMWSCHMFGFNSRPPDPEVVGERWREMWLERLEHGAPWIMRWLEHQDRDAFWRHGSVCEDYSSIECAVYAIGGWADAYSNAIPRLMAGLSCPRKALVGPWAHCWPFDGRPGPGIGFLQHALRWWDCWLKDRDTGIMDEPAFRVWMQASVPPAAHYGHRPGRWVAEETWPSPRIETRRLALNPGRLDAEPAPERALEIECPQTLGLEGGEWCPYGYDADMPGDQRSDDGQSLVFDTEPLAEGIEILGAPVAVLELAVDRPLACIVLRLGDVAPGSGVTRVTYRPLNLAHRESAEQPTRLEPGKRYRLRAPLNDIAHAFPAGHRIRLSLSTTYWPLVWPSPEPVRLTLFTGASTLELPIRPGRVEDADLAEFEPPEGAAAPPHEERSPHRRDRSVRRNVATGETVVEVIKDRGETHLLDIDLSYAGLGRERMSIRDGDPLSARTEAHYSVTLARGDWRVRTETNTVVTATRSDFVVSANLDAFEGDTRVLTKTWTAQVPRKWV